MDTAQWPQEILVKPMEEMIPSSSVTVSSPTCSNIISNNNTNSSSISKPPSTSLERKVRPQKDHPVNCPRCNSTNTKFCYYNNYSLTQPRYFCKTCRRYWTEGGSLRNIPVGGGSRKNKRSSSSSSASANSASSKKLSSHDLVQQHHQHHIQNPKLNYHHQHHHQGQDLNLGFPPTHHHHHQQQQQEFRSLSEFMQLPSIENTTPKSQIPNPDASGNDNGGSNHHHLSALELLNGLTSTRGLTPFMPMPVPDPNGVYSSGFPPMHDFKPSLNFSLVDDGLGNGYDSLQGDHHQQQHQVHHHHHQQQQANDEPNNNNNNNGRLLFPFEDLKQQVSSTTSADHNNNTTNSGDNHDQNGDQGDSTPGYWSGMLGNGGSW